MFKNNFKNMKNIRKILNFCFKEHRLVLVTYHKPLAQAPTGYLVGRILLTHGLVITTILLGITIHLV